MLIMIAICSVLFVVVNNEDPLSCEFVTNYGLNLNVKSSNGHSMLLHSKAHRK
jgi:hypothetical protein